MMETFDDLALPNDFFRCFFVLIVSLWLKKDFTTKARRTQRRLYFLSGEKRRIKSFSLRQQK